MSAPKPSRSLLRLRSGICGLAIALVAPAVHAVGLQSVVEVGGPILNCGTLASVTTAEVVSAGLTHADCSQSSFSGAFVVEASAQASYGTLRADAMVDYEDVDQSTLLARGRARGTASFEDNLAIDVPGRTGEIVDLVFEYEINGIATASIQGNGGALGGQGTGFIRVRVNGSAQYSAAYSIDTGGNLVSYNFGPGVVPITLGTPFEVWGELYAEAVLDDFGTTPISEVYGLAQALFGNSGGFTSFSLVDSNDQPIESFSISSESGQFHLYGSVPEPATGVMLGLALAALLACRPGATRPG